MNLSLIAGPILFVISKIVLAIEGRRIKRKRDELGIEPIDISWARKGPKLPGFLTFPFRCVDAILTAKEYDWETKSLTDRIWYWIEVAIDVLG